MRIGANAVHVTTAMGVRSRWAAAACPRFTPRPSPLASGASRGNGVKQWLGARIFLDERSPDTGFHFLAHLFALPLRHRAEGDAPTLQLVGRPPALLGRPPAFVQRSVACRLEESGPDVGRNLVQAALADDGDHRA